MTQKLPPGITSRSGKFRVSVMVNGERKSGTRSTLAEAIQLRDDLKEGIVNEQAQARECWDLHTAFDQYRRKVLVPKGNAPKTIDHYEGRVKSVIGLLAENPKLDDFDEPLMMELGALMAEEEWVASSRNNCFILLKSIMKFSRRMNKMSVPIPDAPPINLPKKRPRFVTTEQEDMILGYMTHVGDGDLHDLSVFLCDTGLRVQKEALPVSWKHIDLEKRLIHIIEGKGDKERSVIMTRRVQKILKQRRLRGFQSGPFEGMSYRAVRARWQRRMDRMDWSEDDRKKLTLHVWRHTFCTRLVSAGIDIRTVQELAGHADISTTMRYTHFVPSNAYRALAALEQRLDPGAPEAAADQAHIREQ